MLPYVLRGASAYSTSLTYVRGWSHNPETHGAIGGFRACRVRRPVWHNTGSLRGLLRRIWRVHGTRTTNGGFRGMRGSNAR